MHNSKVCKTKPCGCEDQGLHTQPPCEQNTPSCPNPDECAETFSGECIVYTGDTIVDADIQYGDRFNEIVQKLALMILNPNCMDFLTPGTCYSPLNLMSISVSSTGITVKWDATVGSTFYVPQYKLATAIPWTNLPNVLPTAFPSQVITGLLPATEYHIRIQSVCAPGACFSLTILVKTNP